MSSDTRSDNALAHIVDVRQAQMLCRRYVAEEVCAAHCGQRAADSARDMVIARSNVGYERSEHIERCAMAEAFLQLHVRSNLVIGNMTRSFHHNLYALIPRTLRELAQVQQLLNLRTVSCVSDAARTQTVAQADGYVIFSADVENFVIILVQRILLIVMQHPAGDKAAATADNVHLAAFVKQSLEHVSVDATVNGHEVCAILRLHTDNVENILFGHLYDCATFFDGFHSNLIHRHSADHNGGCADDSLTRCADIVASGKIHNGICACFNSCCKLLQLRCRIRIAAGGADVSVNLYGQARADATRNDVLMVDVAGNSDGAIGNALTNKLRRYVLLLCDDFHSVSNDALTR